MLTLGTVAIPSVQIRVSLWWSEHQPKKERDDVASLVLGEMRNKSSFDACGKARKTSAYAGGVPPANTFDAEIFNGAGLANGPLDVTFRNPVALFEPRIWMLSSILRVWSVKEAKEAYDLYILPGFGHADKGLMVFWQNRKTYVHALIEMYRFVLDCVPDDADLAKAVVAKEIGATVQNVVMLLQLEFSTTVRKMLQLGRLGEVSAEGPRPNMPFWLVDTMKADASRAGLVRAGFEPTRGRGGRDRGGRGRYNEDLRHDDGRGDRDHYDRRRDERRGGPRGRGGDRSGDRGGRGTPKRERDTKEEEKE